MWLGTWTPPMTCVPYLTALYLTAESSIDCIGSIDWTTFAVIVTLSSVCFLFLRYRLLQYGRHANRAAWLATAVSHTQQEVCNEPGETCDLPEAQQVRDCYSDRDPEQLRDSYSNRDSVYVHCLQKNSGTISISLKHIFRPCVLMSPVNFLRMLFSCNLL